MQNRTNETIQTLKKGKNLFITGAAGVGKSYTTNAIVKSYEDDDLHVIKLASTAMAATHIGGQTLHSFFELRLIKSLPELEHTKHYKISSKLKKILAKTHLIVIDEISMVSAGVLDLVRFRLMQAGYEKSVLVVGDFLQLSPVVKRDEKESYCKQYEIENATEVFGYAFDTPSWRLFEFETLQLTKVYRTKDQDYMLFLDDIRRGICQAPHINYLQAMYEKTPKEAMDFTFLYAVNKQADEHNIKMLNNLETKEVKLDALFHGSDTSNEEFEKFCITSRIAKTFVLKEGADILFTKNHWNYFNGERGKVHTIDVNKGIVTVEKSNGVFIKVERERFEKRGYEIQEVKGKEESVEVVYFSVFQFPFSLAYAITIHKAQGMGIEDLVIDTDKIFAPSQFYVALSRAISPHRLILQGRSDNIGRLVYVDQQPLNFYRGLKMV